MKPYKSPGVDGWRVQELKLIPWSAIIHLSQIFREIWNKEFSPNQMLARTVLLAKTLQPATFSDGRPITILGYIPRLTSKMVADQLLNSWGERWDSKIASGLPFSAVKDITVQQQYLIEQAHQTNCHYGGFTLDLVKAFNLIPRQLAKHLLVAWGAPDQAVSFWIRSLNNMSQMLQVRNQVSDPVHSTTGAPEGDAMSVCAMLVIAATYFRRMTNIPVTPFTYADNWTFMSTSQRHLFRAFVDTLNFAQTMRMKIDLNKSWGWGTNSIMRQFWKTTEVLFPRGDVHIDVKLSSRDLGCMMQYSKKIVLGCLKTRIQSAKRRLYRLQKLDLTIVDKGEKNQSAIWPLAFYGAESQMIGNSHFVTLRRLATDALIGKHKYASSHVALQYLSDKVMDPLLYVIVTGLCTIRRLFYYHGTLAQTMWSDVIANTTSQGPCGALAGYLSKVFWTPHPDGCVDMPSGHRVCLKPSRLKRFVISAAMLGQRMYSHRLATVRGSPLTPSMHTPK